MQNADTEKLKRIINDPRLYAKNFLKIKTKAGTLIPLNYNSAQTILADAWDDLDRQEKPVRIIVLKARREGISTFVQSRFFRFCCTKKYRHGKVVAHEAEATETLFEMSKTFYDEMPAYVELPGGGRAQIRPKKEYSNAKEMTFSDLKSQLSLKTAGKDSESGGGSGAGRGQTVHFLHCSEVAFWPAAKQTLTALLQTVPNLPGTVVILESTANGVGDHFHKLWIDAKKGANDFVPVFLPWHIFDEYEAPLAAGEVLEYDDEEKSLLKRFPHITDAKLKWRRYTIRNECQNDVEQFHQEYPADDQEAFIVSGRPFFNSKAVLAMRDKYQREPERRGYLKDGRWLDDPKGYLSIYEPPQPGGRYVVGADVAEGLEKGDYSAAHVVDRDTGHEVAKWHGHIDADLFGVECVELAKHYNHAWLGIEANNHGLTALKAAVATGYDRIFEQQILDERTQEYTNKLGWRTDTRTRPLMLDELEQAVREGSLIVPDEATISEMLTFVRNEKGKPEAQGDCHDDLVMSLAITWQMHQLCVLEKRKKPLAKEDQYLAGLDKCNPEYIIKRKMLDKMQGPRRSNVVTIDQYIKGQYKRRK